MIYISKSENVSEDFFTDFLDYLEDKVNLDIVNTYIKGNPYDDKLAKSSEIMILLVQQGTYTIGKGSYTEVTEAKAAGKTVILAHKLVTTGMFQFYAFSFDTPQTSNWKNYAKVTFGNNCTKEILYYFKKERFRPKAIEDTTHKQTGGKPMLFGTKGSDDLNLHENFGNLQPKVDYGDPVNLFVSPKWGWELQGISTAPMADKEMALGTAMLASTINRRDAEEVFTKVVTANIEKAIAANMSKIHEQPLAPKDCYPANYLLILLH
jgi:hypothetical protein